MDKKKAFADVEIGLILQLELLVEQVKPIITKEKKEKEEKKEEKPEFDMNLDLLFDSFLNKSLSLKYYFFTITSLSIAQTLPTPLLSPTIPTLLPTIPVPTPTVLPSSFTIPALTLAALSLFTTPITPTLTTIPVPTPSTLSSLITSPITIPTTTFFNDASYYNPTFLIHFTYITPTTTTTTTTATKTTTRGQKDEDKPIEQLWKKSQKRKKKKRLV
jgi:hypothetical protein